MRKALLLLVNAVILIGDLTINILRAPFTLIGRLKKFLIAKVPKLTKYAPFAFKSKYFVMGILVSSLVVLITQGYEFVRTLPSPRSIGKINFASSTHIFDRNGKLLFEIYRDQNRTPVKLKDLPPYVYQAAIAFEDKDFFNHNGVSPIGGIVRAIKETFIKKDLQGGSTITQQLVKNALLTPERTLPRKIKEAILALWTERLFTKKEILEMYLNQVPYGGSSYGIEEAAKTYFGVQAKDLSLDQAALLATLPQAPSLYSPYVNPRLAHLRRNDVLNKMKQLGYINESEKTRAQNSDFEVLPPRSTIKAPHFVFFIKNYLESLYGIQNVEEGGLKVITTLDLEIQEEAERILKEELDKIQHLNVTNGAILVTNPSTGDILAMVGSKDYFTDPSGAFNVTTALRQPGSAGKPLLYSLALEQNYTAATMLEDTPVTYAISGSEAYKPVNYDNRFHGRVSLRSALANSYNVPAVKTLNTLGVDDYIKHARKLGITTWTDPSRYGLSLALGGGEVTMIDMATAFGTFANGGLKAPVTGVNRIENLQGKVIFEKDQKKVRVLNEGTAFIISDILADNEARRPAFGSRSALEVPGHRVAVKTGTTNDKRDNWTVGYTPELLTAVWVGNNDNTAMHPTLTSGITGAAPIWNRVMDFGIKKGGYKGDWFRRPDSVTERNCFGKKEYFIRGFQAPSPILCNARI